MITDEDKLVAREIRQDCYNEFSDPYQGASDFDVTTTQELIAAYRQRIEARCSLQFGEFSRRREDDIATLREENARLREALTGIASPPLTNVPDESYSSYDEGFDDGLAWAKGKAEAALAAQAPEARGESGEATELRDALELMVDAAMGSGDATQALGIARALLARKPAEGRGPEVGDLVAWDALKKLAEEQFEVRAKHAREGKQAGIEAGDTSEVQCFACELQMLTRGFDAWLMAYHLMRRAEVEVRVKESTK